MRNIVKKILDLKQRKNAVILAHSYQNIEIDEVADFVGDSLYLSRKAQSTNSEIIVFAGVYFMAQTAKIISPDKKVLLPNKNAGCLMADMINLEQIKNFKSKYPNIPSVCYINSTAEVKAECDICCTSSNVLEIIKSLHSPKILFAPDENLGKWAESKLNGIEVITYNGNCPVHNNVKKKNVVQARLDYPAAKILIHPECCPEVSALGDYVGSTSGIFNYVKKSHDNEFVIVTEQGVCDRLKRDYPNKKFISLQRKMICDSMKLTTLEEILESLEEESFEIKLDDDVRTKSSNCIERMLKVQ